MSHDVISDFLKRERLTASHLWELVEERIDDSADAYLIIDDSVQDKRYCTVNRDVDWVITNDPDETVITQVAQNANELRWQVEEFHRELKQLTGSAKCQCRKARSQRNHLACCYHAWLSLKVHATLLNKTIYRVHTDLFSDYLRNQLRCPTVPAFQPT